MMKERGLCKCLLLEISSKERWVIESLHLWVFFSVLKRHVASLPNTRLKVSLKQQTLLTPQAALFLLAVFKSLSCFNLVYIDKDLIMTNRAFWFDCQALHSFNFHLTTKLKYAIDLCKIKKVKRHLPLRYMNLEAVTSCLSKYPFESPQSLTDCCSLAVWSVTSVLKPIQPRHCTHLLFLTAVYTVRLFLSALGSS